MERKVHFMHVGCMMEEADFKYMESYILSDLNIR